MRAARPILLGRQLGKDSLEGVERKRKRRDGEGWVSAVVLIDHLRLEECALCPGLVVALKMH